MNNINKTLNFAMPFLLGVLIANLVVFYAPLGALIQSSVTGGSEYDMCLKYKQYLDMGVLSSRVSDLSSVDACAKKYPELWYLAPGFDECRAIKFQINAGNLTDYLQNDFSKLDECNEFYGDEWTKPMAKELAYKPDLKVCNDFVDVPMGHPLFEAVSLVNDYGIITGYSDCTFRPNAPINRAEAMKVILVGFDYDTSLASVNTFSDVSPDDWFFDFVNSAKYFGVVDGYPDGTFKPGNTVLRSEMIKMFVSASDLVGDISTVEVVAGLCPDVPDDQVDAWYMPYFQVAKDNGLIGAKDNCAPGQEMSRGQVAEVMFNYSNLM